MPQLRPASFAERRLRDQASFAAWGRGLSLEQYGQREELLRSQPWPRASMTTWLWLEPATGQILSSCETYELTSYVGATAGKTWAVASVFTEESLRGQRHASAMLTALLAQCRATPQAHASILFSDVGAEIYQRLGYEVILPGYDYEFSPQPAALSPLIQWLTGDLPVLVGPQDKTALSIAPSPVQLAWHRTLEALITPPRAPLSHQGAMLSGQDGGEVYWIRDPKDPDQLAVLWFRAETPEAATKLLAAARHTAFQEKLSRVNLWPHTGLPAAILHEAKEVKRKGMLPMMAPLCPGLSAWQYAQRGLWV